MAAGTSIRAVAPKPRISSAPGSSAKSSTSAEETAKRSASALANEIRELGSPSCLPTRPSRLSGGWALGRRRGCLREQPGASESSREPLGLVVAELRVYRGREHGGGERVDALTPAARVTLQRFAQLAGESGASAVSWLHRSNRDVELGDVVSCTMITVPEAARRAGRKPETVRRWIREGRLRAGKVGTQHVIEERDLEALIETPWTVEIPAELRVDRNGNPQPDWESIVRESRDSH